MSFPVMQMPGNYSTYIYKGTGNLYHMCVWDFNNACNNYFEEELPYTGFFLNNRLWFEMLIKDEDFTERVIQRYHSLRKGLLSEESLDRYIDETLDFIEPALARNDARWGSVEQQAKGLLVPLSRNLDSESAAEGQLKVTCRTEENGWMKTLRLCVSIQRPPV